MKQYLQKNINKEAKELMTMQSKLQEYDHENKALNRQVLRLLQENTRLKMERVQNNIINICPKDEKKRVMQMICQRRLEKYKYQELMEDENGKGSPGKGKIRVGKLGLEKEVTFGKENKDKVSLGMSKLQEDDFFTFGTNSGNNPSIEKVREDGDKIVLSSQKSHTELSQKTQTATDLSQSYINVQATPPNIHNNRSSQKKREFTSNKKLRTIHSIRPSPQITPIRYDKDQNTTPTKDQKPTSNPCFQSRQKKRQNESTEKRKRYIEVLSIPKTPTKHNPYPQPHH